MDKKMNRLLLLLSAFSGAAIASGRRAVWQDPLESAQVLAGLVTYPSDNPFYAFHVKVWSIINQIVALMLFSGMPESTTSLLLSAMVGAISFAGIFLITESVGKNPYVAFLAPMFMYSLSLVGASSAYPIALLGSAASYGIVGLSFMLLVLGLLGTGRYRSGAFLAAIAPAVHPGLGMFCVVITLLALFINRIQLWSHRSRLICSFALGGIITCLSFGWQIHNTPVFPTLDPVTRKAYLEAFINNLDFHRAVGGWLQLNVLFSILLAILSTVLLRKKFTSVDTGIVLASIAASVATALTIVLLSTHFPPFYFLNVLIPWRFINYANICLIPLTFGILAADFHLNPRLRSLLLAAVISSCMLWRFMGLSHENILYVSIFLLLFTSVFTRRFEPPERFAPAIKLLKWTAVFSVSALLIFRQVVPGTITLATGSNPLKDRTNIEILRIASERQGILLTAGDMHQIQLVTRRPVLLDGAALDIFPYVVDTGPRFNEILNNVYGLDIFTRPPETAHFRGSLTFKHRSLWEQKTYSDWQDIKKKFGVTDILTPLSWNLQLPAVTRDFDPDGHLLPYYVTQQASDSNKAAGLTLYTIP